MFYPWADVLERKGGASLRVGHLVDFLRDSGFGVTVAAPGVGQRYSREGVEYRWYRPSKVARLLTKALYRSYRAVFGLLSMGRSLDEDFMLWNHFQLRMDSAFAEFVEEVVDGSEAVFLEYTFWGKPVIDVSRRMRKKVIVTAHDVLAYQVRKTPWLRKLTLLQEIRTLKAADHAICVSSSDQDVFRGHGVESLVVPHGIDTQRYRTRSTKLDLRDMLEQRLGAEVRGEHVCLFVGSLFAANIAAVDIVRDLAETTSADRGTAITFLVAGACCAPQVDGNFISLGRIDDEVLELVYQLADVVLIPLTSGTGASVKTIEAMAQGKVVLGTTIGLRGYPVTSGVNCIISDKVADYPRLIREISGNERDRHRLENNARAFALPYDFRTVYRPYVELLEPHARGM